MAVTQQGEINYSLFGKGNERKRCFVESRKMIKRGDKVKIVNKDDIEAVVIGFYAHTMDVLVKTKVGHEWIVSPVHLKKIEKK